jgi:hypothetical protein
MGICYSKKNIDPPKYRPGIQVGALRDRIKKESLSDIRKAVELKLSLENIEKCLIRNPFLKRIRIPFDHHMDQEIIDLWNSDPYNIKLMVINCTTKKNGKTVAARKLYAILDDDFMIPEN